MKVKGAKKKSLADDIDALISSTKPKSVDIDDEYGDFASSKSSFSPMVSLSNLLITYRHSEGIHRQY